MSAARAGLGVIETFVILGMLLEMVMELEATEAPSSVPSFGVAVQKMTLSLSK